jgi:hypothetical protein
VLQLKTARRVIPRGGGPIRERLGRPDERLVFVIGCPRSGTTFLGGAVGTLPGFVDLGEVHALKASIPELAALPPEEAAPRIRRLLDATRRIGLVGARRAVEQTPETSFVARAAALAFPEAAFLHIVRDGRDVVCSLLERGWLSGGREGTDDAGLPYGAEPRFWVEAGRREEFTVVSDARRAAWAWRRYVGAARALGDRAVDVRYERLSSDPGTVAAELAERLGVDADPLATRLAQAHAASVGRFRTELGPDRLADVEDEAGALLAELGYVD